MKLVAAFSELAYLTGVSISLVYVRRNSEFPRFSLTFITKFQTSPFLSPHPSLIRVLHVLFLIFFFFKEDSEIVSYEPRGDDYPNRETSCGLFRQFLDDDDRGMGKVRSDSAVYSHM